MIKNCAKNDYLVIINEFTFLNIVRQAHTLVYFYGTSAYH
jgi:hypothetical protein